MNNIQLKIKLVSIEPKQLENETLKVTGNCKFQYQDRGRIEIRSLAYSAFGQVAKYLQTAGVGTVHVVAGTLDIQPPDQTRPNHSTWLSITQAVAAHTAA